MMGKEKRLKNKTTRMYKNDKIRHKTMREESQQEPVKGTIEKKQSTQ